MAVTTRRLPPKVADQGNGVRSVTLIVSASDSKQSSKDQSDYLCTGSKDQTTINNAINNLPSGGGEVRLMEGTYWVDGAVLLPDNVTLSGQVAIVTGKHR